MIIDRLRSQIGEAIGTEFRLNANDLKFEVGYSADPKFGDLYTNVAMVVARASKRKPREVADHLAQIIQEKLADVKMAEVAGPGFINIALTEDAVGRLAMDALSVRPADYKDHNVVVEYSDPNPFKVLHVGHLYTSIVGDAITNLIRVAGGEVHPVNFGGDVGLHVAKTMWSIVRELGGELPTKLEEIPVEDRATWMARNYVAGTKAYEDNESVKHEIMTLNKRVYQIHTEDDHSSPFAQIYWKCRDWSYAYFDAFYARIGSHFEKYYPESETAPLGLSIVREQQEKGVYTKSDGAIVFDGEKYGLHTRVFITSQGLPTYEAKDVGLIAAKWRDYHFDNSVIITGNDIIDYMKVVLKSIEQFAPDMAARTTHITHGNVKLAGGVKMSSRKGNFLGAVEVLDLAAEANRAISGQDNDDVVLGAVKYAFLKQRIGADITYVPEESVALEGHSGPYLQYAHARARSILDKSKNEIGDTLEELDPDERTLALKLAEYPVALQKAVDGLVPHYVATYLYELAQEFNRFYEANRVIGDKREAERLQLVALYADVLRDGLNLLGMAAPNRL